MFARSSSPSPVKAKSFVYALPQLNLTGKVYGAVISFFGCAQEDSTQAKPCAS